MKNFLLIFLCFKCLTIIGIKANPFFGKHPVVQAANPNEYSYVARLEYGPLGSESHFCSATLISTKHILTSAQCLDPNYLNVMDIDVKNINAKFALHDNRNAEPIHLTDAKSYAKWMLDQGKTPDLGLEHDIAIAKLNKEVQDIEPVTISGLEYDQLLRPNIASNVESVGYGPRPGDDVNKLHLNKAPLLVVPKILAMGSSAGYYGETLDNLFKNHIFTRGLHDNVNFQNTDRGGPLLHNGELIGVNSHANLTPFDTHSHLAHISVDRYRDFIKDVTEKKPSPPVSSRPNDGSGSSN